MDATLTLIRRAQGGEQEALGKIFSKYYSPVRAYVRRRLGNELRLEAESVDIMQEVFMGAVEHFDRFEVQDDANLINWLSRIAENRIRDLSRKAHAEKRDRRRQRALKLVRDSISSGELQLDPVAPITLPGEALERKDKRERLSDALDQLKTEHRDVIMHRTYSKATWEQVAKLMDLGSEAGARNLHARAMVELAAKMGRE